MLILNQAGRCAQSLESMWGFQGFGVSLSRCFITFWYCLLGIVYDLFSFSSLQHCPCTQVPGHGACPSRYLFVKYASSHTCHTQQNIIYNISPSPICDPHYIREVMNNEQGNSFSQQRKYLGVFCPFSFQEIKNLDWRYSVGLYNFNKIPLACSRGGCFFLLCVGPSEPLIFQRHLKRKHGIPSQCVAFSGCRQRRFSKKLAQKVRKNVL